MANAKDPERLANTVVCHEYLVQKRGESPGIAVGTNTVLHQARKRHVATVVARVSMLAIPARGEHQLQTQSDRAGPIEEGLGRERVSLQRPFRRVAAQTVESDGFLSQRVLRDVCLRPEGLRDGDRDGASLAVTPQHAEVGWEGRHGAVGMGVHEIVSGTCISQAWGTRAMNLVSQFTPSGGTG